MAKRIILYTSQSEGMTLGVSGETWMECLLALSEEFGEGLLPLYEKTKEELANVSEAVAQAFEEELVGISEDMAQAVIDEAEKKDSTSEAQQRREKVRAALESVATSDQPDGGGEQQSLPEAREEGSDEDDAAPPSGGDGDPVPDPTTVCSICGGDTTPDYAKLTKLEHGEVRCPNCTP